MYWKQLRQTSLKVRLLVLVLPVMALFTATGLWMTRTDAAAASNAAYDRSLLGAMKALELNVSTASGGLAVELPYRLFEFFELTATGNVYFRVATADGLVEIGNPDLPAPPLPLKAGQAQFYDALYFGESVRVGAVTRALAQPLDRPVDRSDNAMLVIQVAESTASREQFTRSFLQRAMFRDAVFLLTMGVVVAAGLWVVLRPLGQLAAKTRARDAEDIRPLQSDDLPADVRPLVDAVNQQLGRIEALMAQRRSFVDDASHQLRTPLTILRAQLDFILRETDPQQRDEALSALSDALGQAIRGTNQLLTLARSDAGGVDKEPFDLVALTRQVALELLPVARERGIDFGVEGPDTPLVSMGDPSLLKQAFLNIAHNALLHGKARGVVTLMPGQNESGYFVSVVDDGGGMDSQVLKQLGQRFSKGRGSRGSGLGMAIATSVMQSHNGKLTVVAGDAGVGLRVTLWWPSSSIGQVT